MLKFRLQFVLWRELRLIHMALIVLRSVFLMAAVGIATLIARSGILPDEPAALPWLTFLGILAFAIVTIAGDAMLPEKRIDTISAVYFGSLVGVILTVVVNVVLTPLIGQESEELTALVQLGIGALLCYMCVSFLLQTKDDFRFIIPYVEFSKEIKGRRPYILDTSVVIDGRIADLVDTNILENQLILPRFVVSELQGIADSSDKLRRSRGRRGLDIVNRLRANDHVDLKVYERETPEMAGQPVDMKLVLLARHMEGKVITGDYNLNKVAKIHNIAVINLNDIANSLKPVFLPGENIEVRIVKEGEGVEQGVGYLDDGTMIVVEGARRHINETVDLTVTSVLQTSAGRMIFGRYVGLVKQSDQ